MKDSIKKILFTSLLLGIGLITNAQTKSIAMASTLGITTRLKENNLGYHIGLNPYVSLTSYFSLEAQFSYIYVDAENGSIHSLNTLLGGRLYLDDEDNKSARFYYNFLIGGLFNRDTEFDSNTLEKGFGFSSGLFLEFKNMVLGISYDTPKNLIFKAGYRF